MYTKESLKNSRNVNYRYYVLSILLLLLLTTNDIRHKG